MIFMRIRQLVMIKLKGAKIRLKYNNMSNYERQQPTEKMKLYLLDKK